MFPPQSAFPISTFLHIPRLTKFVSKLTTNLFVVTKIIINCYKSKTKNHLNSRTSNDIGMKPQPVTKQ